MLRFYNIAAIRALCSAHFNTLSNILNIIYANPIGSAKKPIIINIANNTANNSIMYSPHFNNQVKPRPITYNASISIMSVSIIYPVF